MVQNRKIFRGGILLTSGRFASYALSFVRSIILARMLTKADFGLAAVFAMAVMLLEITSRMAFGQQIVQAKDGDSESFQATAHTFQFGLALVGAVLMATLSGAMASAFKVPEITWAFAAMAVVPLARGFEHLDSFRFQRQLNFVPSILCDLIPQVIITVAACPLILWLGDFRAIVWIMAGRALLGVFMTHLLSKRCYRWGWQWGHAERLWAFGWPLILTGIVAFAGQQADQVLVGAFLSLQDLATYALALSLVGIPWFIFAQVASSIVLPVLSKCQENPDLFRKQYRSCVQISVTLGIILTLPAILIGEQLVTLIYGANYAGAGIPMALLGAAFAVKFLRLMPAISSMARGDTLNELYSNMWRCISLPLAAAVALVGGSLGNIAFCALAAELLAGVFSLGRLQKRQGVSWCDSSGPVSYLLTFLALELGFVHLGGGACSNGQAVIVLSTALVMSGVVAWFKFPVFSRMLAEFRAPKLGPSKPSSI